MKVNKDLEIALTAAYQLRNSTSPVKAKDLALQIGAPLPFLNQILCKLVRAKIARSVRGPSGGYSLTSDQGFTAKSIHEALGHSQGSKSSSVPVYELEQALSRAYGEIAV